MGTFLDTVVAEIREDLKVRSKETPPAFLESQIGPAPRGRPFSEALISEGISLIAEMKRASPSKGPIRPDASVSDIVTAYEGAGARACSVLTEERHFGGSLDDLRAARAAVDIPLLRKDFLVDPYQLLEARAAGADAALLIVAGLSPEGLAEMMAAAAELGLDVLVEVHSEAEVEAAVDAGAEVIGVNNRDLQSLEVDLETTFRLLADIPAGTVVVAESGITTHADVSALQDAGVDAILVGEALMTAPDTSRAVHDLLNGTT